MPGPFPSGGAPPSAAASSTTATTASNKNKRKRPVAKDEERRARLRRYGVDLPDIAGMPVQLVPVHVNALQVASKFFCDNEAALHGPVLSREHRVTWDAAGGGPVGAAVGTESRSAASGASSSTDAVLEGILHRMDAPSTGRLAGVSSNRHHQQERARSNLDAAVADWLQAVQRHLKDNDRSRRHGSTNDNYHGDGGGDNALASSSSATAPAPPSRSVVMASIRHLWEQVLDHKQVWVRRAALYLSAQLLYRSAECRKFLLESSSGSSSSATTVLMEWMDRILGVYSSLGTTEGGVAQPSQVHLQEEAYGLLRELHNKGYGRTYPTLGVALLRFRQIGGSALEPRLEGLRMATDDDRPAVEAIRARRDAVALRASRDQALQHHEREEAVVQKLLRRAGVCMDVLFPRFGFERPAASPRASAVQDADIDDNDDDDSVDWEDGGLGADDDGEGDGDGDGDVPPDEGDQWAAEAATSADETAVERTLAAMKATGGVVAGEIEISFEAPPSDADHLPVNGIADTATLDSEKARAKSKLEAIVSSLTTRHLPRLVDWTEGLVEADGLVESRHAGSNALVSMPSSQARQRKSVLEKVRSLKGSVSSVLSLAKRLGIESGQHPPSDAGGAPSERPRGGVGHIISGSGIAVRTTPVVRLATSLDRRHGVGRRANAVDPTRGRSNRIQVKYRKS